MPIRNRAPNPSTKISGMEDKDPNNPSRPLLGAANQDRHDATSAISSLPTTTQERDAKLEMEKLSKTSQWIVLAIASGGCAAFNGVFAKL